VASTQIKVQIKFLTCTKANTDPNLKSYIFPRIDIGLPPLQRFWTVSAAS